MIFGAVHRQGKLFVLFGKTLKEELQITALAAPGTDTGFREILTVRDHTDKLIKILLADVAPFSAAFDRRKAYGILGQPLCNGTDHLFGQLVLRILGRAFAAILFQVDVQHAQYDIRIAFMTAGARQKTRHQMVFFRDPGD